MSKKKDIESFEVVPIPIIENDMERLNNKHYEKQMSIVRHILNIKKKGFDSQYAASKVQLAQSYVDMVYREGEENMDKYWRKSHGVKKDYKGIKNEI